MMLRFLTIACLGALLGWGCTPAPNDDGGGGSGGAPEADGQAPDLDPGDALPADMQPGDMAPEPDMAPPEPDMAPPEPDMAPPEPDMAPPEPDMAPPEPDMAPPEPDMAPPPACEDDDFEDDDRPIDAVALDGLAQRPVGEGQSVDRRLCGGDDDVYAVDGCATGRLEAELRFRHADGDLTLTVVDLFGAALALGESATDDELAAVDLDDGAPVFVRVSGPPGVAVDYTLRLIRTCPECVIDDDCARGSLCEGIRCLPGECRGDADCPDRVCVERTCVQCGDDDDCPDGVCAASRCVGCRGDGDCPDGVCEGARCVQCRGDGDCRAGVCVDAVCVGCGDDADCPGGVCIAEACAECRGDGDCPGGRCDGGRCVQCLADGDCPAGVCAAERCVQCAADGDCPGGVCADDRCVECAADGDCADGVCVANGCVECRDAGDCPGGVCAADRCVECAGDGDCPGGVCVANGCVQCRADRDCPAGFCGPGNACVDCLRDADCGGGVCVGLRCVECEADRNCPDGVCEAERCVQCRADGDCRAGVCVDAVCLGCAADGDCPGGVCVDAACAECRDAGDCAGGICAAGRCVQCAADGDCPAGVCEAEMCVQCRGDGDCPDGVCADARCVECAADDDCPGGVCAGEVCAECAGDDDCPDGFCVAAACAACRGDADCGADRACAAGQCVPTVCADPLLLPPGVAVAFETAGENNLGADCGGDGPEQVLSFTPPADGIWCISTVGSSYDTVLYVREDGCISMTLACNDDSDVFGDVQSSIDLAAEAGHTYTVVVDGYFAGSAGPAVVRATRGACVVEGPRGPAPGELVITEMMPDPAAVTDNNGEWFEIYNAADVPLDLEGMLVSEADGGNDFVIEGSLIIEAGGYLVLGKTTDRAVNGGAPVAYAYGGAMALGNAADDLQLTNVEGQIIDAVAYDGGPIWPDPTGASMQLGGDPAAVDNSDGARWCEASQPYGAGDLGSPGAANPPCP